MERLIALADDALALCRDRGWRRDWEAGAAYLTLEVAEFTEALRGKRGSPVDEAGDILFVLLSVARHHNLSVTDILDRLEAKITEKRESGYTGGYVPLT